MKLEISSNQLASLTPIFTRLQMKFSTVFVAVKMGHREQEDHQIIWIKGSPDNVYLAKMALTVFLFDWLQFELF